MQKIRVEAMDGKTRDERETCFPIEGIKEEKKGAGMR